MKLIQFLNLKNIWGVWIMSFTSSIYGSKQGRENSLLGKVLAFQVWSWLQSAEHTWNRSWRDDLVAKSTGLSCSVPKFVCQHPHGDWQALQLRFPELWCPLLTSAGTKYTHGAQSYMQGSMGHAYKPKTSKVDRADGWDLLTGQLLWDSFPEKARYKYPNP